MYRSFNEGEGSPLCPVPLIGPPRDDVDDDGEQQQQQQQQQQHLCVPLVRPPHELEHPFEGGG